MKSKASIDAFLRAAIAVVGVPPAGKAVRQIAGASCAARVTGFTRSIPGPISSTASGAIAPCGVARAGRRGSRRCPARAGARRRSRSGFSPDQAGVAAAGRRVAGRDSGMHRARPRRGRR